MNPLYRLQIDVCVRKPIEDDNIWLRRIINIPFVPRDDDSIRLLSLDEESVLTITLANVVYATAEGQFEADITDDTLVDTYSLTGTFKDSEVLQNYLPFEFIRLNMPVAQVVRA